MALFKNFGSSSGRDFLVILKIVLSGLTAAFLIFFISALAGVDLVKNNDLVNDLDKMLFEINTELDTGIDARIKKLGEAPVVNPYKKFYSAELAKEIHEVSYLTEKQKILFNTYNVRDFEQKSLNLVKFSETGDTENLLNELEIVKRELKNSANLIITKRKRLFRQKIAYIILFFVLWTGTYIYYSRGILKKIGSV